MASVQNLTSGYLILVQSRPIGSDLGTPAVDLKLNPYGTSGDTGTVPDTYARSAEFQALVTGSKAVVLSYSNDDPEAGFQGAQGRQGNQGNQGRQGWQGNQGNQGAQGNQGNQGWQGVAGTSGSFTATAGTTSVVSNANALTGSKIFLQPTNAGAAGLQGNAAGVYISSISNGVSFTVTTPTAGGTETFNYLIA